MDIRIIITICILLLIAYLFNFTAAWTRIPAVLMLLVLGWASRQLIVFVDIQIPDLNPILPVLGTIGLILIVLEGSLELELTKSKFTIIKKSIRTAILPLFAVSFLLALGFWLLSDGLSYKDSLTNAIPFCVISSAIAIPSVKHLKSTHKQFIIYESSLSDIVGVIFFNFVAHHALITWGVFGEFGLQILLIAVISLLATIGLSLLLSHLDHHVKFAPIMVLIILIFAISELYHLPALVFILVFGMFLSNFDELKRFKIINRFSPEQFDQEVAKFRELVNEAAFLVRALFFLLFGFLIETSEIINPWSLIWAVGIVTLIFTVRAIQLKLAKLDMVPLLFIAPRGLITILLFFSIPAATKVDFVSRGLTIQVILITSIIMMIGLMITKNVKESTTHIAENVEGIADLKDEPEPESEEGLLDDEMMNPPPA